MKHTLSLVALLALTGCAMLTSTTTQKDPPTLTTNAAPGLVVWGTNGAGATLYLQPGGMKTTTMTGYALFDASTAFASFANNTNGTTIGNVNESASSTNLNSLISAIVSGAIQGAAASAK